MDVLVSVAVVGVLIGLMMPSLASVRETTRRVICQSNVRQVGLALAMYADDWSDRLPNSSFTPPPNLVGGSPEKMFFVRTHSGAGGTLAWDGLGFLFAMDYLSEPGVLYCPSHVGEHAFSRYAPDWNGARQGDIAANYHFRGAGPKGSKRLYSIAGRAALVSDSLGSREDFNHQFGSNVLRADISAEFFNDQEGEILKILPNDETDTDASVRVISAWSRLDDRTLRLTTNPATIASDR